MEQDHPFETMSFEDDATSIYSGLALVRFGDEEPSERYVDIDFRWLPSPRIMQTITMPSGVDVMTHALGDPAVIEGVNQWPPTAVNDQSDDVSRMNPQPVAQVLLGDGGPVDEVRLCVINLWAALSPLRPTETTFNLGPWSVDLVLAPGAAEAKDYLSTTRLYAMTHLLRIRRQDGAVFDYGEDDDDGETDRLIRCIWHALSFMNGTLVGLALPCGYRSGEVTWCRASVTTCDRGGYALTWSDPHHFISQANELVPAFIRSFDDPFLRRVLPRIVRVTVDANDPMPLDTAVPMAQAGLELLAWAVLVEREEWLQRDARLDAAGRIRLLLRWAGVPVEIPSDFDALLRFRPNSIPVDDFDGPRAVTLVRRDVVHPPKSGDWPDADAIELAWRLGLTYLELCTLRLVGYEGAFGSRHYLDGRWTGTVERVPWMSDES